MNSEEVAIHIDSKGRLLGFKARPGKDRNILNNGGDQRQSRLTALFKDDGILHFKREQIVSFL